MEDQYRYRVVPSSGARLFGFSLLFAVAFITPAALVYSVFFVANLSMFSFLAGDALRVSGVVLVIYWVVSQILAVMFALWVAMRWGRFSGAQLRFVRPNLVDRARFEGGGEA